MTEEHKKLLTLFEIRLQDLMAFCDKQNQRIRELESLLELKEDEIRKAINEKNGLTSKYENMLTARVVSVNEGEIKNARLRLSKLVREVEKCIALLNE